jgi:hypothetical protein
MPVEAPASLANELGGDAALAGQAWAEVRDCLMHPKHRHGLTVFMRLVAAGADPLLVDAEQLQQQVAAACSNITSAKTAKQVHCQLPHIFDALGRHLPSTSSSQALDGQLWPRGVRPFALTPHRRVDPVNPVTSGVKKAITAAAAAAAVAPGGSEQQAEAAAGGSPGPSAAAVTAAAPRKVAVSAAVTGVQYLACLAKGVDFTMRLTRSAAGASLASRSLQPQQPGASPLAQAPVTSKEQAANALRMALLHLLRLYEAARPLNAAVRLRHADLWTYFGSSQVFLLTLVYLDPAITAELLSNYRPSKVVTATWQGKGKQQSLLRQRHTLPAAYNLMDLIEGYVIVSRLLIELADGFLPGAAGAVADEQRSSPPPHQESDSEDGQEEDQPTPADAALLLEQLAAFVDNQSAAAAAAPPSSTDHSQQQQQAAPPTQPAAALCSPEPLVFGPGFCASTASRGAHGPALAHSGLYPTRRAAAQELLYHNVAAPIIRILFGHSFNSDMHIHYASNNTYLTGADGHTQLQLATDLGGPVLRIGEALTLSLLPPGVAQQHQPVTVQRLVLEGALPARLAEQVAPVGEEVRLALAGPDAAARAAAAAALQRRIQRQMTTDREALATDADHLVWLQRAINLNLNRVHVSPELISPMPELQEAVVKAQSRLRRWFQASPDLMPTSSSSAAAAAAGADNSSSSSSSSNSSSSGAAPRSSIPPLIVSGYLPFLLGDFSLAHAHLRDPSGEPSPQLRALLDACHAAQAPGTSPADAAIQQQQAPGAPPVIIQTAQIRVAAPPFSSQAPRAGSSAAAPLQPPPEAAAVAARLRKAGEDLQDALAALSAHAVCTAFPAAVWEFAALAADPCAEGGALQQAAAGLLQQGRAAGDSVIQQGVAQVMTAALAQKAAAGQMELEQQRVAGFLETSVQQQAAAQLAGVQVAVAADERELGRQQQRLAVRQKRVEVGFHEQAIRGMQGGGAGKKRAAAGAAGGSKRVRVSEQAADAAAGGAAAAAGVEEGDAAAAANAAAEWQDSRPGVFVDAEWYLQEGDHCLLEVAGQLAKNPVTLNVQMPSGGAAYVWMFRVEKVGPLHVRFYENATRQLESGQLQLRACVEQLRVVQGMRLVLAPCEPGEELTQLAEGQLQELLEGLMA